MVEITKYFFLLFMIDITHKQISLRTATAVGKVLCSQETLKRIKENTLPKGDLFNIAKAAGLLASKNTHNLIPHCHPVSVDGMEITYEYHPDGVEIRVLGKSIGRTGIEMEVLTACSVAALTIYDLLKPIDKNMEITSLKLTGKTGGKSEAKKDIDETLTTAILVCSDSTAAGKRKDNSGVIIRETLEGMKVKVNDYKIIPDNPDEIKKAVQEWVDQDIAFIFTTGGTGLGPRDNTVDTIRSIIDRDASGITETMRMHGVMRTSHAMLSRAVAGTKNNSVIVTLPGSSRGARESLDAILPGLFHARKMILGGGH